MSKISDLIGSVLLDVIVSTTQIDEDTRMDDILFVTDEGTYRMYHDQCCCESVTINDIDGDIQRLVGDTILDAREEVSESDRELDSTYTWTFYIIRTVTDSVTIRWYGTSNGYYSEEVSFELIDQDDDAC